MKKLAIAVALSAACTTPAFAEGQHQIGFGWLHVNPQEKSDELKTTYANGSQETSAGTSSSLSNENTLGLIYTYIADDHVSIQLVGGVPPKFELKGKGMSSLGNLGDHDKLATVRQWSPTALGIYTFGSPSQKLRPYIGVGVTYTKFTDIKLDSGFEAAAQAGGRQIMTAGGYSQATGRDLRADAANGVFTPGSPNFDLALATTLQTIQGNVANMPVRVRAEADDAIDPTVVVGLDYQINKNWYAQLSASYLPLETTATIYINGPTGTLARSEAKMDINPIVGYLGVAYRF